MNAAIPFAVWVGIVSFDGRFKRWMPPPPSPHDLNFPTFPLHAGTPWRVSADSYGESSIYHCLPSSRFLLIESKYLNYVVWKLKPNSERRSTGKSIESM